MTAVALEGVEKGFHGRALFRDVSIDIPRGSIIGIEGHNGSGKSVLLKIVCRFLRPDRGRVYIAPEYLSPRATFPQEFGVLIDRPGYIPHRTGIDNLRALARIRGIIGDEDILDVLRRVGLDPAQRQQVRHYSLGMKQRLAIAQAIMEGQQVLVLDEPFNALDADSVTEMRQLVTELNEQGRTVIMTSHQEADIASLCHSVYRLERQSLWQVR